MASGSQGEQRTRCRFRERGKGELGVRKILTESDPVVVADPEDPLPHDAVLRPVLSPTGCVESTARGLQGRRPQARPGLRGNQEKGAGSPGLGHVGARVQPHVDRAFSQGRRRALGLIRTSITTTVN